MVFGEDPFDTSSLNMRSPFTVLHFTICHCYNSSENKSGFYVLVKAWVDLHPLRIDLGFSFKGTKTRLEVQWMVDSGQLKVTACFVVLTTSLNGVNSFVVNCAEHMFFLNFLVACTVQYSICLCIVSGTCFLRAASTVKMSFRQLQFQQRNFENNIRVAGKIVTCCISYCYLNLLGIQREMDKVKPKKIYNNAERPVLVWKVLHDPFLIVEE